MHPIILPPPLLALLQEKPASLATLQAFMQNLRSVLQQDIPETVGRELGELLHDLTGDDELGVVVRLHVRIEGLLYQFVQRRVLHPEHVRKMRLEYDQLVTLARALGIPEGLVRPLRFLGTLRNRFAHEGHRAITGQDATNLRNTFDAQGAEQLEIIHRVLVHFLEPLIGPIEPFRKMSPLMRFVFMAMLVWARLRHEADLPAPGSERSLVAALEPVDATGRP